MPPQPPSLHLRQVLTSQERNDLCARASFTWLVCSSTGFIGCCRITGQSELCTACGRDPSSTVSDDELLRLAGSSSVSSTPLITAAAAAPITSAISTAVFVTRGDNSVPTTITSLLYVTSAATLPTASSGADNKLTPGAAAGAGVGGVLGVLMIIGLFFLFRRRRTTQSARLLSDQGSNSPEPPSYLSPSVKSPKEHGIFEPWKRRFSKQTEKEEGMMRGCAGGEYFAAEIDEMGVAEMDGRGVVEMDAGVIPELPGEGERVDVVRRS